jgi:hypothetical protein
MNDQAKHAPQVEAALFRVWGWERARRPVQSPHHNWLGPRSPPTARPFFRCRCRAIRKRAAPFASLSALARGPGFSCNVSPALLLLEMLRRRLPTSSGRGRSFSTC